MVVMKGTRHAMARRFRKLWLLGEGATSQVFEVVDRLRGGRFALKQLRPEHRTRERIARFEHEFSVLKTISHPNVVKGYELIQDEDAVCLLMEPVLGVDFLDYVRRGSRVRRAPSGTRTLDSAAGVRAMRPESFGGALDAGRLKSATMQLLHGLRAVHAAGRVHCDLKPENVLVTRAGRAVIVDLGSASSAGCWPGRCRGTPGFIAPEQFIGRIDSAVDLYALGALLHCAVTGRLPLGASSGSLDASDGYEPPLDPRIFASGIPDDLVRLVLRLLAPEPCARPSVQEVETLLDECLSAPKCDRPALARVVTRNRRQGRCAG